MRYTPHINLCDVFVQDLQQNSMENLGGGNISSGKMSPSPNTPTYNQNNVEFEFGCITPSSSLGDSTKDSPVDQFFLNGKLLPYSFPTGSYGSDNSQTTSRTSSISSKDSLMWSRSNSTSSRSSSNCSSTRTSSSEVSERRTVQNKIAGQYRRSTNLGQKCEDQYYKYQHGSSKRWQFITAAPGKLSPKKKGSDHEEEGSVWRRVLRSMVKTCKARHAMETAVEDDNVKRKWELN
ncbi:hypothetical protein Ancab_025450 [Ancistrocladus abbreviatus]